MPLKYLIALSVFILDVLLIGVIYWQTGSVYSEATAREIVREELAILNMIGALSRETLIKAEYGEFQRFLIVFRQDPLINRIVLADSHQRVVAATEAPLLGQSLPAADLGHGRGKWRTLPLRNEAGEIGELFIEFSDSAVWQHFHQAQRQGLLWAGVGISVSALLGLLLGHVLTRRLKRLARAAQRISSGELEVELDTAGTDEVALLSRDFAFMAARVKATINSLQESEERYRSMFTAATDGICIIDTNNLIKTANPAFLKLTGYARAELIGQSFLRILHPDCHAHLDTIRRQFETQGKVRQESILVRKDEIRVEVESQAVQFLYDREQVMLTFIHDITARNAADRLLRQSLREKDILLREIHHRVKNNMQVVSSLLKLQSTYLRDQEDVRMILGCQERVKSMAMIHHKLYQSADLGRINFREYLGDLCTSVMASLKTQSTAVTWNIDADDEAFLGMDAAVPCGLIVTELLSNALKYAFLDGRQGEIRISLRSLNAKENELLVSDNGVGLPPDFDFRASHSMGFFLVTSLTEHQLGGAMELRPGPGTTVAIRFPAG